MSFLKKIFKGFFNSPSTTAQPKESQYLPEIELPIDEEFTMNFKNNGGKFLYCETEEELQDTFVNILVENDWFESEAITFEKDIYPLLQENRIYYRNVQNPIFFIANCESLIADEGSILFSSTQLSHLKTPELPTNIIVFAKTSQITRSKSDGLRIIKNKYLTEFPSNITAIKCFNNSDNDSFMHYGSAPKNLYLILLEDL